MPSDLDEEFRLLFKWANAHYPKAPATPEVMVRLLSVEGVRDELKVSEIAGDVPSILYPILRRFRQLSQKGRLSRTARLLKES